MKHRVTAILLLIFIGGKILFAQQGELYPYFPAQTVKDNWKVRAEIFGSDEANSNTFTNKFFKEVNNSGYIDPQLKADQLDKMNGDILTGTMQRIGAGVYINSRKLFYYAGIDHQQVLDSRIGSNLVRLLLQGNKPFAGTTLEIPPSVSTSIYFNRLVGGVGYAMQKEEITHTFFGKMALTSGQNYDYINVDHASLYTHPDGDYLDMTVKANTQLSDTVWAGVFDINGMGLSFDLSYSLNKKNDYFLGMSVSNLGFVNWNGNTFSASIDTSFVFEGITMDTTSASDGEVPDDYSYKNLRRILFKDPDGSPFTTGLPVIINLAGGKYFDDGRFYAGINAFYYPTLEANYKIEVFGTWNHRSVFQLTPIFTYSAYQQLHFGLAAGVKIGKNFIVQAGSNYLDSFFNGDAPAGTGGFVRMVFVR